MLQRYTTGHHCTADCTLYRSGDEEMSALQIYIINRLPLDFSGSETMEPQIDNGTMEEQLALMLALTASSEFN